MLEKFEGEMLSREHRDGEVENVDCDFNEALNTALSKGRIKIEKSNRKGYPLTAREMLSGVTDEDVETAITEQADFSKSPTWYVYDLNEMGYPTHTSTVKEGSIGETRNVYLTVKKDPSKDTEIKANVSLLHLDGHDPEIVVLLYASKIDLDFERAPDDGRCLACEGWGCWNCNFSGGY
jgi:hypothetical protein